MQCSELKSGVTLSFYNKLTCFSEKTTPKVYPRISKIPTVTNTQFFIIVGVVDSGALLLKHVAPAAETSGNEKL